MKYIKFFLKVLITLMLMLGVANAASPSFNTLFDGNGYLTDDHTYMTLDAGIVNNNQVLIRNLDEDRYLTVRLDFTIDGKIGWFFF